MYTFALVTFFLLFALAVIVLIYADYTIEGATNIGPDSANSIPPSVYVEKSSRMADCPPEYKWSGALNGCRREGDFNGPANEDYNFPNCGNSPGNYEKIKDDDKRYYCRLTKPPQNGKCPKDYDYIKDGDKCVNKTDRKSPQCEDGYEQIGEYCYKKCAQPGYKNKNIGGTVKCAREPETKPIDAMTCNQDEEKKETQCYKKCMPGYIKNGDLCIKYDDNSNTQKEYTLNGTSTITGMSNLNGISNVNGTLNVMDYKDSSGNTIQGTLSNVNGKSNLANIMFTRKWSGHPDNKTDAAEISNDTNDYKKLMIVGNKSSGDGIRKVGIWDQLDVNGRINIMPSDLFKNSKGEALPSQICLYKKDGTGTCLTANGNVEAPKIAPM
jgi:hypothetical protein